MTDNPISIGVDTVTLRLDDADPIIIPRRTMRTRLQLIDWVYRLTAWPGMTLSLLRKFIAAVFRHHGWSLPEAGEVRIKLPPTTGKRMPAPQSLPAARLSLSAAKY